jgi:hypothetical protein
MRKRSTGAPVFLVFQQTVVDSRYCLFGQCFRRQPEISAELMVGGQDASVGHANHGHGVRQGMQKIDVMIIRFIVKRGRVHSGLHRINVQAQMLCLMHLPSMAPIFQLLLSRLYE